MRIELAGLQNVGIRVALWILVLPLFLAGCITNPYTGRHQFLLFSQGYETRLGEQAYQAVLSDPQVRLAEDPRAVEPVRRVANRIIEAAKQSKYADRARQFEWDVSVIQGDQMVNAFALPGGKIGVYTGLLPVAQNEAGLAVILGHEVAHALARHGAERMSQGLGTQVAMIGAAIFVGQQFRDQETRLIMTALGLGAQVGVLLPFSRKHESEADYVGLLLAAQAGYNPLEAIRLWERMEKAGGNGPPEFLSTHPSHGTRIAQLEAWMPEALTYHAQADKQPSPPLPSLHVQTKPAGENASPQGGR